MNKQKTAAGTGPLSNLFTFLAAFAALIVMVVVFLACGILAEGVPVWLFAFTAPLVWGFSRAFHGKRKGVLLIVLCALFAAIAMYLGWAVHAASIYCRSYEIPAITVPLFAAVMLTNVWILVPLYTAGVYSLLFSVLGVLIVAVCIGDPFTSRRSKRAAKSALDDADEEALSDEAGQQDDTIAEAIPEKEPDVREAADQESFAAAAAAEAEAEASVSAAAQAEAAAAAEAEAAEVETASITAEAEAAAAAAEASSDVF